jgi:5S rRNA maturation endonuclease (ribonuclease M5)
MKTRPNSSEPAASKPATQREREAFEEIKKVLEELNGNGENSGNGNGENNGGGSSGDGNSGDGNSGDGNSGGVNNEIRSDSFLIIVEGRKDALSLRNLGVSAEIYPCANQPVAAFCEQIAHTKKKAVILTDWDRKGRILASRFIGHFQNLGVPYDETYRKRLLMYTKKEIKDVESLYAYVVKLKQKCHELNDDDDGDDDFDDDFDLRK